MFCPTDVCSPQSLLTSTHCERNDGRDSQREERQRTAETENEDDNEDQSIKMDNEGSMKKKKNKVSSCLSSFSSPPSDLSLFIVSPLQYVTAPLIGS